MTDSCVRRIIMLYGHPSSGKSTASAKIKEYLARKGLRAEVISSAKIRLKGNMHRSSKGFIDEENERTRRVKDKTYSEVCKRAEKFLMKRVLPILDCSFHKHYRRQWVYNLAKKKKADLYILWVIFNDASAIRNHLRRRESADKRTALHTWEQYITMLNQTEKLDESEFSGMLRGGMKINIIKFDRKSNKTRLYGSSDAFAKQVVEAITH